MIIAGIGLLAVYALFDPASTDWMPKCPVHLFTGWECPGCGSQRAIHALLHGDIAEAFAFNAFMVILLPYLVILSVAELNSRKWPRLHRVLTHPDLILVILGLIVLWTLLRNLLHL